LKSIDKEKIRILFGDVIKGFSSTKYLNSVLYLKHLNIIDNIEVEHKKYLYFNEAQSKGLPTKDEKEAYLLKENLWTDKKNEEINKLKNLISNLKISKSKAFRQTDVDFFKKEISKEQFKLNQILIEKNELIGYTAEDHANKKVNEYFIFCSLFKKDDLKEKFFSEEDYENLSKEDIDQLTQIYNIRVQDFSSISLKKIALSSYYLNLYNVCNENIYNLYGKPVIDLTYYQIEVYNHARYFRHELSDAKHKPPPEAFEDPELLIEWLESARNAEEIMNKSSNKNKKNQDFIATSIVGASKEDVAKISKNQEGISLQDIAKKHGGTLSMEDFIKLHKL